MKGQFPVRPARHYKLTAPPRLPEPDTGWPVDPFAQPGKYWHRLAMEAVFVVIDAVGVGMVFYGLR